MLSKIKSIFTGLPQSKKRLVLALIILLIITLLFFISKPPPTTDQQFGTLPQPSITSFSEFLKPLESTSDAPSLPADKTTIAVYQLPTPSNFELQDFLNPIATEFNFTQPAEETTFNSTPHLLWNIGPNYLALNLQTGQFYLKLKPQLSSGSTNIIESDAFQIANRWLINHQLLPSNSSYKATYLKAYDSQFELTPDAGAADIYQFHFFPTINNLPIFSTQLQDSPVTVAVTNQGNIIEIDYQLPTLFYSDYLKNNSLQASTYPLKTQAQLSQEITQGLPIIASSQLSPGKYPASTTNIKKASYEQITLGYQADPNQNLLLPVFQLKGTAVLEDGITTQITAYLPAATQ